MDKDEGPKLYSFLSQWRTEDLDDMLSELNPMDEIDSVIIDGILNVLRERDGQEYPAIDVEKAWEEFQTYYNTPEGEGRSLYPMGDDWNDS